jgi:hypothetical protein
MNNPENNSNQKSNKRLIYLILSFVIFPLLVLMPLITVYLSSSGLNANKKLKAEMKLYKDSIKIPANEFLSIPKNIETNRGTYEEKVLVLHFYDKDCKDCQKVWSELLRIQKEFSKKTKRIHLITYVLKDEELDSLSLLLKTHNPDTSTWEMLVSKDDQIYNFLNQMKLDSLNAPYTFILADRKGIIANKYDARKTEEINNLMRHATMLLPAKEDRRKIKYKREKELYQ